MTELKNQYISQSPSNPPLKREYNGKEKVFESGVAEKKISSSKKDNSQKNKSVLRRELSGNAQLVHIHKNFNVASTDFNTSKKDNVVESDLISRGTGFNSLVNETYKSDKSVSNVDQVSSKFDSKKTNLATNNIDKSYTVLKNQSGITNSNYNSDQLKQIIKLGRANLNVVKEFKKDVPVSRLPIMYKDDVEALLSRKPNSVRNFVNSLNRQLKGFASYNNKYKASSTEMYNMGFNSTNNSNCRGCSYKKLGDPNGNLEGTQRNGVAGNNDYRESSSPEKYSAQSQKITLNMGAEDVDNDYNRNLSIVDNGCGRVIVGGKDVESSQVQEEEALTYRGRTFGSLEMSAMGDYAKNASGQCSEETKEYVYSRCSLYDDVNASNYLSGGTNEFNYANNGSTFRDYRAHDVNDFNYGTSSVDGLNCRSDRIMSIVSSDMEGYGGLVVDGGYYDNFNSYFNRHFNNGYRVDYYTGCSNQEEVFKNAKMTCRTNLTGVNTDECVDNCYTYSDYGRSGEVSEVETMGSMRRARRLGDVLFSKRFLQSFNTLPEGVNLVIDTPKSQTSNASNMNTSSAMEATSRLESGHVGLEGASMLGIGISSTIASDGSSSSDRGGVRGFKICGRSDFGRALGRCERVIVNSVNLIKSGWVWVQSSRTKNWVPKFVVLFYDSEKTQYTSFPYIGAAVGKSKLKGAKVDASGGVNGSCSTRNSNKSNKEDNKEVTRKDYNRYFIGDVGTNDGFWRIYELYTQINPRLNLNTSNIISMASSGGASVNDMNKLIEDNSAIYLCILNHEPENYYETIKNGNYLQLYTVDTSVAPFLRSFNSCWLSRFLSRKINAHLEMIIISLTGNYEFSFVPLCAAKLNSKVSFTYEMEMANKNKVNEEYDGWMFKLWEYSLRSIDYQISVSTAGERSATSSVKVNGKDNREFKAGAKGGVNSEFIGLDVANRTVSGNHSACGSEFGCDNGTIATNGTVDSNVNVLSDVAEGGNEANVKSEDSGKGMITRCYEYICSLFFGSTPKKTPVEDCKRDQSNFRSHIIKSINNNQLIDDKQKRLEDEGDSLPSPKNFINWIDKYGFDDLSIKMNMYALIKR